MRLPIIQKQLIESCLEKGKITLNDFWKFYSTQESINRVGERLQMMEILKQNENGELIINKSKYNETKELLLKSETSLIN